ncbi:hypothetical protein Acr_00g0076080 [Actinidia rufa]|uniref:Uncharacterized protein n=1 Tax=Actinidia rufa TaxID=165716 RepID=A0A7J0DTE1_9ERIC|nr:hypothetical protein Acr_00g0076080 [Actinidia rufa]
MKKQQFVAVGGSGQNQRKQPIEVGRGRGAVTRLGRGVVLRRGRGSMVGMPSPITVQWWGGMTTTPGLNQNAISMYWPFIPKVTWQHDEPAYDRSSTRKAIYLGVLIRSWFPSGLNTPCFPRSSNLQPSQGSSSSAHPL